MSFKEEIVSVSSLYFMFVPQDLTANLILMSVEVTLVRMLEFVWTIMAFMIVNVNLDGLVGFAFYLLCYKSFFFKFRTCVNCKRAYVAIYISRTHTSISHTVFLH